jgi:hypothetical protein
MGDEEIAGGGAYLLSWRGDQELRNHMRMMHASSMESWGNQALPQDTSLCDIAP